MFKVDVEQLASASRDVQQEAQDIRVAYERTSAALADVAPTAAGNWYKTGKTAANQFKRDLKSLRGAMTGLSDAFGAASAMASGTLLAQYGAVLSAAEGSSSHPNVVCLDEGAAAGGSKQYAAASIDALQTAIDAAQNSLDGLERSGSIAAELASLKGIVAQNKACVEQTSSALSTYVASVQSFETEFAGKLDPSAFMHKSLTTSVNDGVKDAKDAFGILKHGFSLGAYVGSEVAGTWTPSNTKTLADGFASKLLDWASPDKWREAWDGATGANSLAGTADDVADAASGAAQWAERASAVGKLAGYVADGLSVFGIATSAVSTYADTEGDDADKAAAATYEAAKGAAKFASGKAVGAAVGSAFGGPVGTAVGFVAGCAVDLAWDYASDWAERSGFKDKVVSGVASIYRESGTFLTRGFDVMRGAFGLGGG